MTPASHAMPRTSRSSPVLSAVLIAGLFLFLFVVLAYGQLRLENQEAFTLGSRLLDPVWGLASAMVLLIGSVLFLAASVLKRWKFHSQAALLYALTLVLAIDHVAIRSIEWLQISREFRGLQVEEYLRAHAPADREGTAAVDAGLESVSAPTVFVPGNAEAGTSLYRSSCASCHALDGRGVAGQGTTLVNSAFVRELGDAAMVEFLKRGRLPGDPNSRTGQLMPPRGGNNRLTERNLADIVAYIRELDASPAPAAPALDEAGGRRRGLSPEEYEIAQSVIPPAAIGPRGPAPQALRGEPLRTEPTPLIAKLERAGVATEELWAFKRAYAIGSGLQIFFVLGASGLVAVRLSGSLLNGRAKRDGVRPSPVADAFWHVTNAFSLFVLPLYYFTAWF